MVKAFGGRNDVSGQRKAAGAVPDMVQSLTLHRFLVLLRRTLDRSNKHGDGVGEAVSLIIVIKTGFLDELHKRLVLV